MAGALVHASTVALLWLCCCFTRPFQSLAAESTTTTMSTTTTIEPDAPFEDTVGNESKWWTEDHPYMYRYRYKRFANGSVALNTDDGDSNANDSVTLREVRANLSASVTPFERFFYQKQARTAMKDVYRHVLMNLVPPRVHGSVLKRAHIKTSQSKMRRSYLLHAVAIPGVQMLGSLIVDAVKLHYGGYLERQMLFKRLQSMPLEQIYAELNITPPVWDPEADFDAHRPSYTLPYDWKGCPRQFMIATRGDEPFTPYANYSRMYYSRDDDLPPPAVPAESYPWLWRRQLAETRDMILNVMALNAAAHEAELAQLAKEDDGEDADDDGEEASNQSGSGGQTPFTDFVRRKLQVDGSRAPSSSSSFSAGDDAGDVEDEFEAVEEFEKIVGEFHFSTGIPRILQQNYSYFPFPTLDSLLTPIDEAASGSGSSFGESAGVSASDSISTNMSSAIHGSVVGSMSYQAANSTALLNASSAMTNSSLLLQVQKQIRRRAAERKRKSVLHSAMRQFYAYPSVDASMVLLPKPGKKRVPDYELARNNCSVSMPCLVQSSVTVYTPQLPDLDFFTNVVANAAIPKEQQCQARVKVLQSLVDVAFQAEQKALERGIQAPSTVWYSLFDRNVDEFADAVQSHVNSTWRNGSAVDDADGTPISALDVYASLVNETQGALLNRLPSYYWSTLRDTKRAMEVTKAVPALEPLGDGEQIELISHIAAKMKELDRAIAAYVAKRDADEEYQQVVNATAARADYEGNQYSTLGFGFLVPATNRLNVLYRALKLPVPFHLVLRLFVRMQESRLLLQSESLHIVACLAMQRSDVPYYRCRRAAD